MTTSPAVPEQSIDGDSEPLLLGGIATRTPRSMGVRDPLEGDLVGNVSVAERVHVDAAVRSASESLRRAWPPEERQDVLSRAAEALAADAPAFAHLIAREGIKTIREARREVTRAVHTLSMSASAAHAWTEEVSDAGWRAEIRRVPVGVVGAVTPYNDPLNLVVHKIGPALAGGNSVVLKPHPQTPLTALRLGNLLLQSGVPLKRISVLPGGAATGAALITHPLVRFVTFTGGRAVGLRIARNLGTRRATLEMGGVCVTAVGPDYDVSTAAEKLCAGAFAAAGQNCLHVQRVLIHQSVYDRVVEAFAERARLLRRGSKLSEDTDVGPMIDRGSAASVHALVTEAVMAGARSVLGIPWHNDVLYPLTLLERRDSGSRLQDIEAFGPVTMLEPFAAEGDVLAEINRLDGCLQVGVLTHDLDFAAAIAVGADAGAVVIGDTSDFRVDDLPFGGTGQSGLGREGIIHAARAMSEPKVVVTSW
ncbi:MAG: aldehyde dehydrogenase family protein [Streptosporangiaceae bacterium]